MLAKIRAYVARVDPRDCDERSGCSASTPGDLDLSAREIELGTAKGLCNMECDGFHTNEVSKKAVL